MGNFINYKPISENLCQGCLYMGSGEKESVPGRDKVFSTDFFGEGKIQLQSHGTCMAPALFQRRLASPNTPEFITLPIIRKSHTKQYPKQSGIHAFLISHLACQYHTHSTEFRAFSGCFGQKRFLHSLYNKC